MPPVPTAVVFARAVAALGVCALLTPLAVGIQGCMPIGAAGVQAPRGVDGWDACRTALQPGVAPRPGVDGWDACRTAPRWGVDDLRARLRDAPEARRKLHAAAD